MKDIIVHLYDAEGVFQGVEMIVFPSTLSRWSPIDKVKLLHLMSTASFRIWPQLKDSGLPAVHHLIMTSDNSPTLRDHVTGDLTARYIGLAPW